MKEKTFSVQDWKRKLVELERQFENDDPLYVTTDKDKTKKKSKYFGERS
jgi:hypothetical protein